MLGFASTVILVSESRWTHDTLLSHGSEGLATDFILTALFNIQLNIKETNRSFPEFYFKDSVS